jgi:cytosine/adenosine deaminase-related metal-dependent hydrolase
MRHSLIASIVIAHTLSPALARAQEALTAIRNVTVIPGTAASPTPQATIVIRGRRIDAVGPSSSIRIPAGARVIDGEGRFVIPGLIDTHAHIASDVGTSSLERVLGYELANGVTGMREASGMGRERELSALRQRIETGEMLAPRLYVSGSATPQNLGRYRARDWEDLLRQLRDVGVDGIKLRNLTRAQADTVIRLARGLGLPAYGHTYGPGFNLDNFSLDALEAGVTGIMHVAGAGPADSAKPRTLAAVGWERTWLGLYLNWLDASEEQEQRFLQALLSHHAWLEPTLAIESLILYDERYRTRAENRLLWTSYEQVRLGFPVFAGEDLALARQGFKRMQDFVSRFQSTGGMVLAGTDMSPWPGAGIHEELRLLVESGLSPLAALQAATWNPARVLGWSEHTGTIAVGLDADLVILEANPLDDITNTARIWAVVRAGQLLDRTTLDRLLAARDTTRGR